MHRPLSPLCALLLMLSLSQTVGCAEGGHAFDGTMPEQVLRGYLSRSMTLMYLLTGQGNFEDNLRMMKETGVKFAGRAVYNWGREQGGESALPRKLEQARTNALSIHAADPEIILQACVFEIVSQDVNQLQIPGWVFKELELPIENRHFRFEEIPSKPREAGIRVGYVDSFYGRSKGGITPSGWRCEHLPYIVDFDNYGHSRAPGDAGMGPYWVWGWDEITWFSQQPLAYRNEWVRYAWNWVRENDPEGYLEMPGIRCLSGAADNRRWYFVNRASTATPDGSGQEDAVRQIWLQDANPLPLH